jgi:hypothetical protein
MKLEQLPENFLLSDWSAYLLELFEDVNMSGKESKASLERALWVLTQEYIDPYLIAEILTSLVDSNYRFVVGCTSRLISSMAFEVQLNETIRGYPFKYSFFRKCCETDKERFYFDFWIAVYTDTLTATGQYTPRIADDEYDSWETVRNISVEHLDKAVEKLVDRFVQRGYIEYAGCKS